MRVVHLWINLATLAPYIDASLCDFTSYHQAAALLAHVQIRFLLQNHDYPPLLGVALMPLDLLSLPVARLV